MGMVCCFRFASAEEVLALLAQPEGINDFLFEREDEDHDDEWDIDKAWHGLHFLFTGTAWEGEPPLNFILGGAEIGEVDVGNGPARAFFPADLQEICRALDKLEDDRLRARFDPEEMERLEIYPDGIWKRSEEKNGSPGYLMEHFEELREFLGRGASSGMGLIVYLA